MCPSRTLRSTLNVVGLPISPDLQRALGDEASKCGKTLGSKSGKKVAFANPPAQIIEVGHSLPLDVSWGAVGAATATKNALPEHSKSVATEAEINGCSWPEALLKLLSDPGRPVNLVTFNRVLSVFAGQGLVDLSRSAFLVMRTRGVRPDATSYALLCQALAQTGDAEGIMLVMDSFQARGGQLNEHFYDALGAALSPMLPPTTSTARVGVRGAAEQIARAHLRARAVAVMDQHAKRGPAES